MPKTFHIDPSALKEFQRLYSEEFGAKLDDETAKAHAQAYLKLLWVIFSMNN